LTCNLKSKVYEKEINLLKQVEALHKNQEDNKVLEVANNIQLKLSQKKTKIDGLKSKLSEVESLASTLKKVTYFSHIFMLEKKFKIYFNFIGKLTIARRKKSN
jgi:hypothetical protein